MITKEEFLDQIKIQFEEDDAKSLKLSSSFTSLETFDSLTKYSIIAFLNDEYNVSFTIEDFDQNKTPLDIYNNFINKQ